jgi:uncharacterized protein YvpB
MGCLAAVLELKGETLTGRKIHKMIFIESNNDWRKCTLNDCQLDESTNSIIFPVRIGQASLTTFPINAGFSFRQLILSWNASRPDSTSLLEFAVEVSPDSLSWRHFDYQIWGDGDGWGDNASYVKEVAGTGKIDVDNLVLEKPMRYARIVVHAYGQEVSPDISLRRLALSFSSDNSSWDDFRKNDFGKRRKPVFGSVNLAVPYFTQRNLPKDISGSGCSPTSVSMVLNYYGKDFEPAAFAYEAYDKRDQLYGNWPYNMAAAYAAGMARTWVESHSSFDEIYDEVASGKPVIISISYGFDELPHSPIHEAPEGHLIVVVGFDGPDTVICNDPAGHNVDDGIVRYPRRELEKIWIEHGGIAYHIWAD